MYISCVIDCLLVRSRQKPRTPDKTSGKNEQHAGRLGIVGQWGLPGESTEAVNA
jgi:hypothetical protein